MLTDRAEDSSVAMCLDVKEQIATYMKLACSSLSTCLIYSTSFRNDDFSSFKNFTKDWQDWGYEITY